MCENIVVQDFTLHRGYTWPGMVVSVSDADGGALDLDGCTVEAVAVAANGATVLDLVPVIEEPASGGVVRFPVITDETTATLRAGVASYALKLTFADGSTYPRPVLGGTIEIC